MFQSPYETMPLSRLNLTRTIDAVNVAKTTGHIKEGLLTSAPSLYVVVGRDAANAQIPPFPMPLTIENSISGDYTVVDLRQFNSSLMRGGVLREPENGPASLLVKLALLQTIWKTREESPRELLGVSTFPMLIFASWLGNLISQNLALDPNTRLEVIAVLCWYYTCLHYRSNELSLDSNTVGQHALKISRTAKLQSSTVIEIIEQAGHLANIEDLCKALQGLSSVKTDRVAPETIYSVIRGSWFGSADSRQIIAAAMEYPPAFLAILYSAVTDPMVRKSRITEVAKVLDRNKTSVQFTQSLDGYIRSYGA